MRSTALPQNPTLTLNFTKRAVRIDCGARQALDGVGDGGGVVGVVDAR